MANEAGGESGSEAFVSNKESEDEYLSDEPYSDGDDHGSVSKKPKKKLATHIRIVV